MTLQELDKCIEKLVTQIIQTIKTQVNETHKIETTEDELRGYIAHLLLNKRKQVPEARRCSASCSSNGQPCAHFAQPNSDLCVKHSKSLKLQEERSKLTRYPCVYYDDENGPVSFVCSNYAIHNKWCCKKHAEWESPFTKSIFKCRNMADYLARPEQKRTDAVLNQFCKLLKEPNN